MNLIDMHSHSNNSPDGIHSVFSMCNRANELGLKAFCITDHFETNKVLNKGEFDEDEWVSYDPFETIRGSVRDIKEYKMLESKTKILTGIELGQAYQDKVSAKKVLNLYDYDYIICSLHNVHDEIDFYWLDYKNLTKEQLHNLIEKYYIELLEMSKDDFYDCIGHITYPTRYATRAGFVHLVDISYYRDLIAEIFKNVISKGKGIEINTSGISYNLGFIPPFEYLKLYKDLNGEVLTIGSDAHNVFNISSNIEGAIEFAKSVGFSYVTYYEARKPVMLKI